jgi:hypothetical protein
MKRLGLALVALGVLATAAMAQDWFDTARFLPETWVHEIRAIGDVDGDLDVDLISFYGSSTQGNWPNFDVLLNDGLGEFSMGPTTPLVADAAIRTPLVGELTGDNLGDLVVTSAISSPLGAGYYVFPSTGGGNFTSPTHLPVEGNPTSYCLADVDGDDILDLGEAHHFQTLFPDFFYKVGWWISNGNGTFTQTSTVIVTESMISMAAIDVNNDGVKDLVGGPWFSNTLHTFPTVAGAPSAGPVWQLPGPVGLGQQVDVGDLDGDGDDDLIVVSDDYSTSVYVTVIENQGGGNFSIGAAQPIVDFIFGLRETYLGDWDDDGDLDLLAYDTAGWGNLLENDNGQFGAVETVPMSGYGWGGGVADLNQDDDLDFVGSPAIALGRGEVHSTLASLPTIPYEVVDWENDGDLDLLDAYGYVSVNDGQGEFMRTGLLFPEPPEEHVYREVNFIGDFTGDGRHDYLVGLFQIQQPFGYLFKEIRLLADDQVGGYVDQGAALAPGIQLPVPFTDDFIYPAEDLNGDGRADLLVPNGFYLNDGTGSFPTFTAAFSGWQPFEVGDVDADSDLDIIGASWSGSDTTIGLLRNDGSLNFTAEPLVTDYSLYDEGVLLADLDDDTDLDVAVGAYNDPVYVVENQSGVYAAAVALDGDQFDNQYLGADDVDGDGLTDLLSGGLVDDPNAESLLVYRRLPGPGLSYEPARHYIRNKVKRFADLDGDGDQDALGDAVIFNRRYHGSADGQLRQYGQGNPGTGNAVPVLGVQGPLRLGSTPSLRLRRAVGGTLGLLAVGLAESNLPHSPFPGMTNYAVPWVHIRLLGVGGPSGEAGAGSFQISYTVDSAIAGVKVFHQMFLLDSGATYGMTSSNGLEICYGQ